MVPEPPEYSVCKMFLDDLNDMLRELELTHIFAHGDEMVYSKLCQIIWKHPDLYSKTVVLMGGFHQLRVRQKILFKRHNVIGYKKWFSDSGTIAANSVDQAFEGRHYYRCNRVHKEAFSALVQFGVEKLTKDYKNMDTRLQNQLIKLKDERTEDNLSNLINLPSFSHLLNQLLDNTKGTKSQMTVAYLKDVSELLAAISAVREGNFQLHMQAEREMLKMCFAFDHIHYSRYLSYQHVYLSSLEQSNHPAITDLKDRGFGGTLTGTPFSNIHGDLITEIFNGETKRQAGPHRAGFSTNTHAVNTWIKTSHMHAKLRKLFQEQIKLSTSSVHKETTPSSKLNHKRNVTSLKEKLKGYNVNPFGPGAAINITNGKEIQNDVVQGLINCSDIGNNKYIEFVNERLVTGGKSFYDPIKKTALNIGIKKERILNKQVTALKEDRKAFGLILSKNIDLSNALKYPITSVPLSLAGSDGSLRQGDKHLLRNFLIDTASCLQENPVLNARWIVDSMAIIRTLKPKPTYRDFTDYFLTTLLPDSQLQPLTLEIINDVYFTESVKNNTRLKRGKESCRINITGIDQNMVEGNEWKEFFNNINNKNDLLQVMAKYITSDEVRRKLPLEIMINEVYNTWKVSPDLKEIAFECNHEEADTRLVLHALEKDTNVIIVSKDTDVLILMIYAYAKYQPTKEWFLKIENGKFVRIKTIVSCLGQKVSLKVPHVHAITGSDTTSYLYGVTKVKVIKKVIQDNGSSELLMGIGEREELNDAEINNGIKFIQTMCYTGRHEEDLVETRVRCYKNLKSKASQSIPADPDSMRHHLKRVHHQLYYWLHLRQKIVGNLDPREFGWLCDIGDDGNGRYTPLWYEGSQMPPLNQNVKPRKRKKTNIPYLTPLPLSNDEIDLNYIYFGDASSEDISDSEDSDW